MLSADQSFTPVSVLWNDRLELVLKAIAKAHPEKSDRERALVAGLSESQIGVWKNRATDVQKAPIKWDSAVKLAEASGYAAQWVYSGEGPMLSVTADPVVIYMAAREAEELLVDDGCSRAEAQRLVSRFALADRLDTGIAIYRAARAQRQREETAQPPGEVHTLEADPKPPAARPARARRKAASGKT